MASAPPALHLVPPVAATGEWRPHLPDRLRGLRSVLLLGGPPGPFLARFARDLRRAGAVVTKVNLHAGEALFHRGADVLDYTGTHDAWPAFLERLVDDRAVDAMFGLDDGSPAHRVAADLASARPGLRWLAFSEGRLESGCLTLEEPGLAAPGGLPRDPKFYRRLDLPALPPPPPPRSAGVPAFFYGLLSALARARGGRRFAGASADGEGPRLGDAVRRAVDACGPRALRERRAARRAPSGPPFFLLAPGLPADLERCALARDVVVAFAERAAPDHRLVLERPPGLAPRFLRRLAEQTALGDRLVPVRMGTARRLAPHALGVVTVDGAVGLAALRLGRPVLALGRPAYDLPGLTQGVHGGADPAARWRALGRFFEAPAAPDPDLCERFCRYVLHATQVAGSFYRRPPDRPFGAGLAFPGAGLAPPAVPRARPRLRLVS